MSLDGLKKWWEGLHHFSEDGWSQAGEQGVLKRIFEGIGEGDRFCVEFGAKDGYAQSNTRWAIDQGWGHLLMDCAPANEQVKNEFITAENINTLLDKYQVPQVIDLLSIDIDGNDYWVWRAIERKARVVIIECNPSYNATEAVTIKYNAGHQWTRDNYYGASPLAMRKMGEAKGMELVFMNRLNCIFVQREYVGPGFKFTLEYIPTYGWPPDIKKRPLTEV